MARWDGEAESGAGVEAVDSDEARGWLGPMSWTWVGVGVLGVLVGAGVRLRQWWFGRSLWLDESWLASNVMSRGFAELAGPLDDLQTSPLGFLWWAKGAVLLFGADERVLRSLPLIAGLLSLPAMWWVARLGMSRRGAAVAVGFLAVSSGAIRYADEFKQYGVELLMTLVLVGLALEVHRRFVSGAAVWLWLVGLVVAGVVGLWVAYASAFVLAGVGPVLMLESLVRRRWRAAGMLVGVGAAVAATFGVVYFAAQRQLAAEGSGAMEQAWTGQYLTLSVTQIAVPLKQLRRLFDAGSVEYEPTYLMVALLVIGLGFAVRRDAWRAAICVLPIVVTVGASAAGKYPMAGRLLVFLVPLMVLLAAEGVSRMARGGRSAGAVSVVLGVSLLVGLGVMSLKFAITPYENQEARAVLAVIAERHEPGDVVYVVRPADAHADFYLGYGDPADGLGEGWPSEAVEVVTSIDRMSSTGAIREDLARFAGRRVWMVYAHYWARNRGDLRMIFGGVAEAEGELLDRVIEVGAEAHLWRLGRFEGAGVGETAPVVEPEPAEGSAELEVPELEAEVQLEMAPEPESEGRVKAPMPTVHSEVLVEEAAEVAEDEAVEVEPGILEGDAVPAEESEALAE
ncbi:MAG: hypothetical protein AAF823_14805 [Planctomycetota bacterium]